MSLNTDCIETKLAKDWLDAKAAEAAAIEKRRIIEDELTKHLRFSDSCEGTQKLELNGYEVKAVGRINRSVNADMVQELAAEHGLLEHLSELFRWKPEINMKAWQKAGEEITKPLAAAITAKPGRLSYSISKKED